MDDNLIEKVIDLHKQKNWRKIISEFFNHPERSRLLWVFPSEENLDFLSRCLKDLKCDRILSIGCGSGLLEWIITEATGIPVTGVEVDGAWWHSKYAPPKFIPLIVTPNKLNNEMLRLLRNSNTTALLFCYFNNRQAFDDYIGRFAGSVLVIIGPNSKAVHTDPKPFEDLNDDWVLYESAEVRHDSDFIAVYRKT